MPLKIKIAPSLLSANFAMLAEDIRKCEKGGADILHIDSMDGQFVPNITIGPMIVEAVRSVSNLEISCHLMINNPENQIARYAEAGANYISVHAENVNHLHRTLDLIRKNGVKPGLALNPLTPLSFAYEASEYCDFILLMSVNPGFGGQSFINSFYRKCESLRNHLDKNNLNNVDIEVDGGIKIENSKLVVDAGANILVSGTGIFNGDVVDNLIRMRIEANS